MSNATARPAASAAIEGPGARQVRTNSNAIPKGQGALYCMALEVSDRSQAPRARHGFARKVDPPSDSSSRFVGAYAQKSCMPHATLRSPFDEPDLRDGLGPCPDNLAHFFSCDSAAPSRSAGRLH